MDSHPRIYTTIAFVAGVLLTLGFKDFYPDLERRFRQRRRNRVNTIVGAGLADADKVELSDNTKHEGEKLEFNRVDIPEGIEGCIGNTPLFRIKSLSEETGCEILGKAEVRWTCVLAKAIIHLQTSISCSPTF